MRDICYISKPIPQKSEKMISAPVYTIHGLVALLSWLPLSAKHSRLLGFRCQAMVEQERRVLAKKQCMRSDSKFSDLLRGQGSAGHSSVYYSRAVSAALHPTIRDYPISLQTCST